MKHIKLFEAFVNEGKYYSLSDRQTGGHLSSGLNSKTRDAAIEAGIEYLLSDEEDESEKKKIRSMSIKDKEKFLNQAELFVDDHGDKLEESKDSSVDSGNFADLFDEKFVPKEVNEDSDKDRYARHIKDVDEVRPRMAPAPKTDGMMASQGSKYFDLYLQDQASDVCVDKYGYAKGIANWEWMIGQSSGVMFAATAKIANEKYKMLKDLGELDSYGKDYFKRSYFDIWKEWKEFMKTGKLKQAA